MTKYVINPKDEGYELEHYYTYRDENGVVVGIVAYYEGGRKKLLFDHDDWDWLPRINASLEKLPLFGLRNLPKKKNNEPVLIVENERSVRALWKLGICAVTSANFYDGYNGYLFVHQDDWSPLDGLNQVILIFNNDEVDNKYIDSVLTQLLILSSPPKIKIAHLENMPKKGDIVDWLETNYGVTWNDGNFTCSKMVRNPEQLLHNIILEYLDDEAKTILDCRETVDDWPDPSKLEGTLLPVMPLTEDMLPKALCKWIVNVCQRLQISFDFVAVTAIVALGSLIGSGCAMYPKSKDNWSETPNLWGMLIGDPANKKTPAMNQVMMLLERLQEKLDKKYYDGLPKHEVAEISSKEQMKSITNKIKKLSVGNDEFDDQLVNEYATVSSMMKRKPSRRILKTNETSVQSMTLIQQQNQRGILMQSDEIIRFFANWDKSSEDRNYYISGWNNTASYTDIKISRGTTEANSVCISIIGTTQPDSIAKYLPQIQKKDNDGLMQRFQMSVFPDSFDWQNVDIKPDFAEIERVFSIIKKLADMNFRDYGARKLKSSKSPHFRFEKDAQAVFDEWYLNLNTVKIKQEQNPLMKEHLSKYPKLMAALALIFHCIELVDTEKSGMVSIDTAELAIKWCDYLETHARRIYALESAEKTAALKLADLIENHQLENPFSIRDVYGKHRRGLSKSEAKIACEHLVNLNWIEEISYKQKTGRPSTKYAINPKLLD